ncbi:MAG: hypothetical protein ABIN48_09260 [Ginsengibacter sp.]
MKIEQVLIHYLLKHKQLSLQGIGTFILEGAVTESSDPNRPIIIPEGAITYTYDSRVQEDPSLVSFITEHTGKIQPLASADLDSYLILGRQFLNIGNPFIIPGIGTIEKTNAGDLIFKGGAHIADKMEANKGKIEDEGAEEHEENMFNDYQKETKSNAGKTILIAISILIVGLIAWAVWKYAFNPAGEPDNLTEATFPADQPTPAPTTIVDTADAQSTDNNLSSTVTSSDGYTFKVIVNEYTNLQTAETRFANLKSYGRQVILYTSDSIVFKIAEPFTRPLSDTTKVLDSLGGYYGKGKGKIEY